MDVNQALKDAENALRDFLELALSRQYGSTWMEKCGVSAERIQQWKDRQQEESKSLSSGSLDERLIYYADFYDIETILKKNWSGEVKSALGDQKTILVFLGVLGKLRNPDAHRRELLPHQKSLVIGIAGEIRTRLVRYRSQQDSSSDKYYPCIESVRDNYGNIWTPGNPLQINTILRPGDYLEFVVSASDPFGEEIEYTATCYSGPNPIKESENTFSLRIEDSHVRDKSDIEFFISSKRSYHRHGSLDDRVRFSYKVLPPR